MNKFTASPKVAILTYENLDVFEFGCAVELFATPRPELEAWYQTDVLGLTADPVNATGGITVQVDRSVDDLTEYDMMVIPGWTSIDVKPPEVLIDAMLEMHQRGGRIVALGMGVFALAATGLLDGKKATTHWSLAKSFTEMFPKVNFQDNVLYTGEDRMHSSSGHTGAIDLGLYMIRQDYGAHRTNVVAKDLVVSSHRDGTQSQFVERTLRQQHGRLHETINWVLENLDKPLNVTEMAEQACLSRRSFDRQFRSTVGKSPKEWLIHQRINLAQDFLETTNYSVEEIASSTGFQTGMNLRHHFTRLLGLSPTRYRAKYSQ